MTRKTITISEDVTANVKRLASGTLEIEVISQVSGSILLTALELTLLHDRIGPFIQPADLPEIM